MRLAIVLLLGIVLLLSRDARAIETPKHRVERVADGYEIRVYDDFIVAEVTVEGDRARAMGEGFRQLADFIFGNNQEQARISMTAPVIERAEGDDLVARPPVATPSDTPKDERHVVSFVMPRESTLDSLPRPENERIVVRKVAGGRYAALTFDGYAMADAVDKQVGQLRDYLQRDGVTSGGGPLVAQYNPPWTPPKERRNEILIPLLRMVESPAEGKAADEG